MNEVSKCEVVYFKDVKKQIFKKKIEDAFDGVIDAGKAVGRCAIENPSKVVAVATSVALVVGKLAKYQSAREDRIHRERDFYDMRTRSYTRARRKLKPSEQREIERRYAAGERYSDILYSMRLNER